MWNGWLRWQWHTHSIKCVGACQQTQTNSTALHVHTRIITYQDLSQLEWCGSNVRNVQIKTIGNKKINPQITTWRLLNWEGVCLTPLSLTLTQHSTGMWRKTIQRGGVGAVMLWQFVSNTCITKAMNGQDVTPFPKKITMPHAPPLKHPANPMNG